MRFISGTEAHSIMVDISGSEAGDLARVLQDGMKIRGPMGNGRVASIEMFIEELWELHRAFDSSFQKAVHEAFKEESDAKND